MAAQKQYAGLDYFRFLCAFFVIAIHTAPFSVWSKDVDALVTYCLFRVAVPFFLMTTGYFVLAPYFFSGRAKKRFPGKFLVKNAALYLAATLLYLPVSLYAKSMPTNVPDLLKAFFFDGTFYHLWYFPAVLTGCILLLLLVRTSLLPAMIFSMAAYVIGLFGDSYYGVIKNVPFLCDFYDGVFSISSYTRNGIFFAPLFLLLGALSARPSFRLPHKVCVWGACIATACLLLEGYVTYHYDLQKHNSMYLFLAPVMYILFQLLLSLPGDAPFWMRKSTMPIYILHPAVIIAVRGLAKAIGQTDLMVTHTFFHFLLVCAVTFAAAMLLQTLYACRFALFRLEETE